MSRELKFRAWAEGDMHFMPLEGLYGMTRFFGFLDTCVDNPKIMQFTGLLDKNGVEIYEGDIVDYAYTGCTGIEFSYVRPIECQSDGGFRMGGAQIQSNPHMVISGAFNKYVTVIGNIHETPELLK